MLWEFFVSLCWLSLYATMLSLILGMLLIVISPFCLAVFAALRDLTKEGKDNLHIDQKEYRTALYSGRVSHTRFSVKDPKTGTITSPSHSFSYPIFWFLVDLKEADDVFNDALWPLSNNIFGFCSFDAQDHLINGEGLASSSEDTTDGTTINTTPKIAAKEDINDFDGRIRRLVTERTNGKCVPKGDILLLTNLSYFGYCFNPVSFYYVLKESAPKKVCKSKSKSSGGGWEVEAIVSEVSNTPWQEMYCYVLHPDSVDLKGGQIRAGKRVKHWLSTNYIFPKTFHVSPFFEMNYMYDWTIWRPGEKVAGSTNLKRDGKIAFNAFFEVERTSLNPLTVCYYIVRFPVYCLLIQVWIHIQALFLTIKGVAYIPHPQGSETMFSQVISHGMRPYYALKARLEEENKQRAQHKDK